MSATMTPAAPAIDLGTLELLSLDYVPDIPCEADMSKNGHNTQSHPATWLALCSCSCTGALCDFAHDVAAKRSVDEKAYRCGMCDAPGIIVLNYQRIGA